MGGSVGGGGGSGGADTDTGDIPVMDDAEEVISMAGFVSYYTPSDVASVADYYRQELSALGWQENADQGYSDDTTAMLNFEKEGETVSVTAIVEEGRTSVIIAVIEQ
jgi:hypothetical protein